MLSSSPGPKNVQRVGSQIQVNSDFDQNRLVDLSSALVSQNESRVNQDSNFFVNQDGSLEMRQHENIKMTDEANNSVA